MVYSCDMHIARARTLLVVIGLGVAFAGGLYFGHPRIPRECCFGGKRHHDAGHHHRSQRQRQYATGQCRHVAVLGSVEHALAKFRRDARQRAPSRLTSKNCTVPSRASPTAMATRTPCSSRRSRLRFSRPMSTARLRAWAWKWIRMQTAISLSWRRSKTLRPQQREYRAATSSLASMRHRPPACRSTRRSRSSAGLQAARFRFSVLHPGQKTAVTISIVRETINIPEINTIARGDGIFVIQLYTFSQNSGDLFRNALRQFFESGDTKLILDLRGNPGGYLDQAVDIASYFLPVGDTVVTEDFEGKQHKHRRPLVRLQRLCQQDSFRWRYSSTRARPRLQKSSRAR